MWNRKLKGQISANVKSSLAEQAREAAVSSDISFVRQCLQTLERNQLFAPAEITVLDSSSALFRQAPPSKNITIQREVIPIVLFLCGELSA